MWDKNRGNERGKRRRRGESGEVQELENEAVDDTRHHIGVALDLHRTINGLGRDVGTARP